MGTVTKKNTLLVILKHTFMFMYRTMFPARMQTTVLVGYISISTVVAKR